MPESTPPTAKGRATRKRIEDALRKLLRSRPYSAIRIADIADAEEFHRRIEHAMTRGAAAAL